MPLSCPFFMHKMGTSMPPAGSWGGLSDYLALSKGRYPLPPGSLPLSRKPALGTWLVPPTHELPFLLSPALEIPACQSSSTFLSFLCARISPCTPHSTLDQSATITDPFSDLRGCWSSQLPASVHGVPLPEECLSHTPQPPHPSTLHIE